MTTTDLLWFVAFVAYFLILIIALAGSRRQARKTLETLDRVKGTLQRDYERMRR